MPIRKVRIIIDTNLWISFLLSKGLSKLDKLFFEQSVTILFSQELLDEFVEVAKRPKIRKYFDVGDLEELLMKISLHAEFISVATKIKQCRDPKDNFLLSLAIDGRASFLLTGDKDLLELNRVGRTKIVTMNQFLVEFNN